MGNRLGTMTPHDHILTVSALTRAVKNNLEQRFPFVWVRGQVANVTRPASGHVYFSLRDADASLAAVWFKQRQATAQHFDPLTGEVYEDGPRHSLADTLENGQELLCAGQISVYAPRGTYQLLVELAEETGLGRLQAEFDKLKATLGAKGYFSPERKRPLPPFPQRVAVITSPTGAAIHDFLRIAEARSAGSHIHIFPVLVQGDMAPSQISRAIHAVNTLRAHDVIVLIRGGGSLEDLWAFNTPEVAEAVFTSTIPVLAGIGHEIDVTLADMTADMRAATPTHAAQLLWKKRQELAEAVARLDAALNRAKEHALTACSQRLAAMRHALHWQHPERKFQMLAQRLRLCLQGLDTAQYRVLHNKETTLATLVQQIRRSPDHLFALWRHKLEAADRGLETGISQCLAHSHARLRALNAPLRRPPMALESQHSSLEQMDTLLTHRTQAALTHNQHRLDTLRLRLEAVHPYAPLERGYALVRNAQGKYIDSRTRVSAGEALSIHVRDGQIHVRVEGDSE